MPTIQRAFKSFAKGLADELKSHKINGSWRIANAFLDDDPEQGRDYYLRFQDTDNYVDTNQIKMWCRLPSNDPAFI